MERTRTGDRHKFGVGNLVGALQVLPALLGFVSSFSGWAAQVLAVLNEYLQGANPNYTSLKPGKTFAELKTALSNVFTKAVDAARAEQKKINDKRKGIQANFDAKCIGTAGCGGLGCRRNCGTYAHEILNACNPFNF